MAESKEKQLAFSLYFFLHVRYAYTGLKHPRSFWVLAPGLPLFTGSFKRDPANTAAFHCPL